MEQAGKLYRILRWHGTVRRRFSKAIAPDWWLSAIESASSQKLKPCLDLTNPHKQHSIVAFRLPGERGFLIQTGRRGKFPSKYPIWCRTPGELMDFIAITTSDWQVITDLSKVPVGAVLPSAAS